MKSIKLKIKIFVIIYIFSSLVGCVQGNSISSIQTEAASKSAVPIVDKVVSTEPITPTPSNAELSKNDYDNLMPHQYVLTNSLGYEKYPWDNNVQTGQLPYELFHVYPSTVTISFITNPIKRANLNDYVTAIPDRKNNEDEPLISLFYDTRTLTLSNEEIADLFREDYPDTHVSILESKFDDGLNVRIYSILYYPSMPTDEPLRIIQSWDDEKVYCQQLVSLSPRRIVDLATVNQVGENNKLLLWNYNLGMNSQDLSTELQYWEFKDSKWVPCDLKMDIKPFEVEEFVNLKGEERSTAAHSAYSDGIAFYESVRAQTRYIFEEFDVIQKNKKFRVKAIEYPDYYVDLTIVE